MSRVGSSSGFTLIEALLAAMVMTIVMGAVFSLLGPTGGTFQAQLGASDLQQRLRVGADTLIRELRAAGAGPYAGAGAGGLSSYAAPILPYRGGAAGSDPAQGIFFRPDAITLLSAVAAPSLAPGDAAVFMAPDGTVSVSTAPGSNLVQIVAHTYYLRADARTGVFQLRRYDGMSTDSPVVDHVVRLEFEYFGDPAPPALVTELAVDTAPPQVTYGPAPPPLTEDNPTDTWPPGESCTFAVTEDGQLPRLAVLGPAGTHVRLDASMLTDGPWCPDPTVAQPFDADLLRVRRVRVTLRAQAASAAMRGAAGALFVRGGRSTSAERFLPDLEVRFDVAPRNLTPARR